MSLEAAEQLAKTKTLLAEQHCTLRRLRNQATRCCAEYLDKRAWLRHLRSGTGSSGVRAMLFACTTPQGHNK
eukprot:49797-Eustigmatos_ZCMA.PRE.1